MEKCFEFKFFPEFIEYNNEGGSIIYTINIEEDFDYKLKINKVMKREYGSVQLLLDNKPLGTLNCLLDIAISIPSVQEFSVSSLTSGDHKITLKFKDNIKIGIEKILFIKTPIPIKKFLISQSFLGFIGHDGRKMHPIGNKNIVWEKADVLEDGTVGLDAQLDPKENCHSFVVTEIICKEDLETNLRV